MIKLLEGTFTFAATLDIDHDDNGIHLEGLGKGVTIIDGVLADNIPYIELHADTGETLSYVSLFGFTIDATSHLASTGYPGMIWHREAGAIEHLEISNVEINTANDRNGGIMFFNAAGTNKYIRILNTDITASGINLYGIGIFKNTENLWIENNYVSTPNVGSYNSIAIYGGSKYFHVNDNEAIGGGHTAIAVSPGTYGEITGNVVNGSGGAYEGGIEVEWKASHHGAETSHHVVVLGNIVFNANWGIYVHRRDTDDVAPHDIIITGNSVSDCTVGIRIEEGTDITVYGNDYENNTTDFSKGASSTMKALVVEGNLDMGANEILGAPDLTFRNTGAGNNDILFYAQDKITFYPDAQVTNYLQFVRETVGQFEMRVLGDWVVNTTAGNIMFNDKLAVNKATLPNAELDVNGAGLFSTTLGITGLTTATGGIVSGGNIISDTTLTDDLGTSSVYWNNLYINNIHKSGILHPNDRGISFYFLRAYYPFNENAYDYSGNNNHGTQSGDINQIAGRFGRCFDFQEGNPDTIVIPDNDSLDMDDITVAIWINTSATDQDIIRKWESVDDERGWTLNLDPNRRVVFSVTTNGTGADIKSAIGSVLEDGTWHRLVGTYDGTNVKVYVDAILEDSEVLGGNLFHGTADIKIADNFIRTNNYDGLMDELMIYGRAWDAGEVKSDYERNREFLPQRLKAYGCIEGINETVVCTNQNTWYQVTFNTAGVTNLIEADITNNELELMIAGHYQVSVVACFHSIVSHDWELMVKKNDGATDLEPHLFQTTAVADKVENTAGTCLINLTGANDRVELWIRCTDAAGQSAVFDHVSLALNQM